MTTTTTARTFYLTLAKAPEGAEVVHRFPEVPLMGHSTCGEQCHPTRRVGTAHNVVIKVEARSRRAALRAWRPANGRVLAIRTRVPEGGWAALETGVTSISMLMP